MAELIPRLFFLDKKLYKTLKIIKTENTVIAYCFEDEKRVFHMYNLLCRDFEKAYTMQEVAQIVRRPMKEIHSYIKRNLLDRPTGFEYYINNKRPKNLHWPASEIINVRDRLYELAPKDKDGFPSGRFTLASKADVLEAVNGDVSYYVRNADGKFMKVWRA